MLGYIKEKLNNLNNLSEELTKNYNTISAKGGKPDAVKVLDFGDSDDIAVIFNYKDVEGVECPEVEERKRFLLTTSIDKANNFIKEQEENGYKVAKPYAFSKNGNVIFFIAAGKINTSDEDNDYYDDDDDYYEDEDNE